MRFMMIVKSDAQSESDALPDEKILSAMGKYNDDLIKAGVMLAGEGLHPSSKGARVKLERKTVTVTDGPFAEAKELVAGYWLIDVGSRSEAVEWAKRIPGARGEVEVRPLHELTDFPVDPSETKDGWRSDEQKFRDATNPKLTKHAPPKRIPGTTRFMIIHKANPLSEAGALPDPKLLAAMGAVIQAEVERGALLAADGLQPSAKGFRVRAQGANRTVIDGPFAETKELIAGFSIIQVKNKEEAVAFAKRCIECVRGLVSDDSYDGEIEIRQVHEIEEFPVDPAEEKDGWRAKELAFRERTQGN
jgi:hypothetical protein